MTWLARLDRPHDIDLATLAPHGVVRSADLVAAGVAPSTIQRLVVRKRWRRLGAGVLRIAEGADDVQLLHAALLVGGSGAVLSGIHAMRRHGMTRRVASGPFLVLVPADRRRRSGSLAIYERTESLPAPTIRDGVPLAPLDRAVIDTARHLADRDAVRAVLAEPIQRDRTTVDRLRAQLDDGPPRGTALPREVMASIEAGVRSVGEGWAFDLHARSDLPAMLWNPRLYSPTGRYLATPDGFVDEVAMAWEVDSKEFHFSPADWEATLRRRADMTNAGIVVVHHPPQQILADPERVIADLRGGYQLAASRPRPDIRIRPALGRDLD